jgi:hypothetical protein
LTTFKELTKWQVAIGTTLLALLHVAGLLLQFGGKFEYYPRGFGVNGLPGGGSVFCRLAARGRWPIRE